MKKKTSVIFKKKKREREISLMTLLESRLHPKVSDFLKISTNWSNIVGKGLEKKMVPRSLVGNELVVAVEHSSLLHQVSFYRDTIVEKIAKLLFKTQYQIRFVVRDNV
jgi:hypothetical protein